jgi:hypothetical protein
VLARHLARKRVTRAQAKFFRRAAESIGDFLFIVRQPAGIAINVLVPVSKIATRRVNVPKALRPILSGVAGAVFLMLLFGK